MLLCGVGAKPVPHLMQYHCTLLQWEVAKVKQLMNSNMTLTVLNLHSKMVRCAVTLDTSFAQCLNGEYRTVNKARC